MALPFAPRPRHRGDAGRDRGSVLILVLVLMVIAGLIVVPMLGYTSTVLRANSVVSDKSRRQEAVKAGLRVALADPAGLYDHCAGYVLPGSGGDNPENFDNSAIGMTEIDGVSMATRCDYIGYAFAAQDSELHIGLVATKRGARVPPQLRAVEREIDGETVRVVYELGEDRPLDEWYADAATEPRAASKLASAERIWAPNLPARLTEVRSPKPFEHLYNPDCQLYFPGTYKEPLTLSGNVYFASGVYYFEEDVVVAGDANVVVGMGATEGCANDKEAEVFSGVHTGGVFIYGPSPNNISGLGGTFVLGKDARLIVHNEAFTDPTTGTSYPAGPVKFQMNQRYVNAADLQWAASFGVSIMSVNGAVDGTVAEDGSYTLTDLVVDEPTEIVRVPASTVSGVGLPQHYEEPLRDMCDGAGQPDNCVPDGCPDSTGAPYVQPQSQLGVSPGDPAIPCAYPANVAGYVPSTYTHAPRIPTEPRDVTALTFRNGGTGGAYVTWRAPERPGGLPVQYEVRAYPPAGPPITCTSPDVPDWLTSEPQETGALECLFSNLPVLGAGQSYTFRVVARNTLGDSPESASVQVALNNTTAAAVAPAAGTPPTLVERFSDAARVEWTASENSGSTRIARYVVTATPVIPEVEEPPPTTAASEGEEEEPPPPPPEPPEPVTCAVEVPLPVAPPANPDRPEADEPVPPPLPGPAEDSPWYCTVHGLDPAFEYQFSVVAENLVPGLTLNPSGLSDPAPVGDGLLSCTPDQPYGWDPDPSTEPVEPYDAANLPGCAEWSAPATPVLPYEPDPIVDIRLAHDTFISGGMGDEEAAANRVQIVIPGYIAVPQGVFRLYDPHGLVTADKPDRIAISGGIMAASYRVRVGDETGEDDGTLTASIGLVNAPVQRTFKITTTTTSGRPTVRSVAVVQVNQNGAHRINSWEIQ